jgi:hypothetical protein
MDGWMDGWLMDGWMDGWWLDKKKQRTILENYITAACAYNVVIEK